MTPSYYILAKKSTLQLAGGLMAGLFLFFAVPAGAVTPNDPGYPYQQSVWTQIHAPEAWDLTTGSPKVVVAIIDVGVNYNHPDINENIWTNADEIAGTVLMMTIMAMLMMSEVGILWKTITTRKSRRMAAVLATKRHYLTARPSPV